ncbi:hypothetical protein, variant [Cladophialophora immunda]|uniref:Anaphase-promoting complex subunit 4-like WD40 domain-containing protein n=1 Tax=Cladophialophora immunda TaxID=569365 RepID=A0A0D2CMZ4_9EURO|nr:uncharacterized protein PV07_10599 [Cladophialophora immunda]XP_016245136.1 hypothetical protein, variant [Cladophialophora immunda]KIW24919.1 hypothetical protein PV07_10599 [Cladophialophora immunda]KIW24920.1 hypothetical protein, variant [Cladophialophora immunda]
METDAASTFSAKPPPLTSDQLNYLIWRYLQESGYAEAAVKLQRDWNVDAESLPFAKCVKGHALVSLVQKGLRYHHLSLTIDENGRPSKQLNPSMFFFGPESEKPPRELPDEPVISAPSPIESVSESRRQPRDGITNGLQEALAAQPAPKRGRKTAPSSERNGSVARKPSASANRHGHASAMDVDMLNGHLAPLVDARSPSATEPGADENGPVINGIKADDRMDIDEESLAADHHNHEPHIELVLPTVHTLATGQSIGVQVAPAKVANLSASTTILQIPSGNNHEASKPLTRIAWRPRDDKLLTAMGDDFCGFWNAADQAPDAIGPPRFQELLESGDGKLISAMAWEPNGELLAVATFSDQSGQIHLFDGQELSMLEALPASQRAITSLLWHRKGSHLLGIAPYDSDTADPSQAGGSSILLWDLSKLSGLAEPSTVPVPEILVDVDSAFFDGNGIICAAGQNAVYCFRAFTDIGSKERWTSGPSDGDQWTFIRCAWHGEHDAILVAASAETGSVWMPAQNVLKRGAHDTPITGLELRPRLTSTFNPSWKQEFATSSMDGTIKVWQYDRESNSITSVCKLIIGHGSPIMALSYSPDGFCLAGASYDAARIWNAEHGHNLMATWKDEQNLWRGSQLKDDDMMSTGGISSVNGDTMQTSSDHALIWDGQSRRLAFGLGSQVALIGFQR